MGQAYRLRRRPNTGFTFGNFSGDLSGATNPQTVTMSAPRSVTANFGAPVSYTVTTSPAGLSIQVDGATSTSPQTFIWTTGSKHTIAIVTNPQAGDGGNALCLCELERRGSHFSPGHSPGHHYDLHRELHRAIPADAGRCAKRWRNADAESSFAHRRRLLQQRDIGAGDRNAQRQLSVWDFHR